MRLEQLVIGFALGYFLTAIAAERIVSREIEYTVEYLRAHVCAHYDCGE
jgi:heme/copper-type cytochrome/quinol oxidase subunit 4